MAGNLVRERCGVGEEVQGRGHVETMLDMEQGREFESF